MVSTGKVNEVGAASPHLLARGAVARELRWFGVGELAAHERGVDVPDWRSRRAVRQVGEHRAGDIGGAHVERGSDSAHRSKDGPQALEYRPDRRRCCSLQPGSTCEAGVEGDQALRDWVRSRVGVEPGVTVGRAGLLLGLVERNEPMSMSEFGTLHDVSPRTMTVLAAGLEKEGLLQRQRHPTDRRVTLLSLTPAGRTLATRQLVPARQDAATLFDDLSLEDRAELLRLLEKISRCLSHRGVEVSTPPTA